MNGRIVEGGSTLTQQLSKNLFLTASGSDKTLRRKIQEAMLVHPDRAQLHQGADSDDVLQPWLHGPRAIRICSGSRLLFRKDSQGPDDRGSGPAGGPASISQELFPDHESRNGQEPDATTRSTAWWPKRRSPRQRERKPRRLPSSWLKRSGRTNWRPISWRKSASTSKRPMARRQSRRAD